MSEPQTYAELQAAVADWMVRDDMEARIPTFIGMAEARFNRMLRLPEMEADVTSTVEDAVVSLPADFLQMRSIYVNGDYNTPLEQVGINQLQTNYPTADTGSPAQFAIQNNSEIVLAPAPDDETVLVLNYYQKIPALSDDNPTNWMLASHADLYLAAALFEGFTFTRDTEAMQTWATRASVMLTELQRQGLKKAYSGAPLRMRASTAPSGSLSRY